MIIKSDDFDEELEQLVFHCPYCDSQQGYYLELEKTDSGYLIRDYFCEICDSPPGQPAFDERNRGVVSG